MDIVQLAASKIWENDETYPRLAAGHRLLGNLNPIPPINKLTTIDNQQVGLQCLTGYSSRYTYPPP